MTHVAETGPRAIIIPANQMTMAFNISYVHNTKESIVAGAYV